MGSCSAFTAGVCGSSPTLPRFRSACRGAGSSGATHHAGRLSRQETILNEAAARVRRHAGLPHTAPYDRPLVIVLSKLDEWNQDIDRLKAKADEAKVEVRTKYQRQVKDLHAKRDRVQQKLQQVKQAGDDAWEELCKGVDAAWSDLRTAVTRAKSQFR